MPRLNVQFADDALELVRLGLGQAFFVIFEQGRRIGHRRIEPFPEEEVSEVIVIGDIALAAQTRRHAR